ncbi:hypothetical protein ACIBCN_09670 [Nocardia sp. NPDC051052]|uniref:acyl-CoA-like ligand-binding transcription factor n=1 Tax=Nocardia sp. NPDC051052 TaxID=3364322 RepID=UPI0037B63414
MACSRSREHPLLPNTRWVGGGRGRPSGGLQRTRLQNHDPRLRLIAAVPSLQARYAANEFAMVALFARVLADRTSRPAEDYQVELAAAAVTAVMFTAARRWAANGGATPISVLTDQAITAIEPTLTALATASR